MNIEGIRAMEQAVRKAFGFDASVPTLTDEAVRQLALDGMQDGSLGRAQLASSYGSVMRVATSHKLNKTGLKLRWADKENDSVGPIATKALLHGA